MMDLSNVGWPLDFFEIVQALIGRKLSERGVEQIPAWSLRLEYSPDCQNDSYVIEEHAEDYRIVAGEKIALVNGIGHFLNEGIYRSGSFQAGAFRGVYTPYCKVRCMYYASHFYNYYHVAPIEDIVRLTQDCALWGANALQVWYDMHHYKSPDDVESREMMLRLKTIVHHASLLGIKIMMGALANEAFDESPEELRADWRPRGQYKHALVGHYQREICPSKPGGMEKILEYRKAMLDLYASVGPAVGIDYFNVFPYDQGGCTCEQCEPWGSKQYPEVMRQLDGLIKQYHPQCKILLSAWRFNAFISGEMEGLYEKFADPAEAQWVDYIVADLEKSFFANIVAQHGGAPGNKPLLGFPEISMHGSVPWGGFGANPFPSRLQERWQDVKPWCAGGTIYSEGIYEDLNKMIMLSLYNGRHQRIETIVREYAASEFGEDYADRMTRLILLLDQTLIRRRQDEDGTNCDYPPRGYVWKGKPRFVIVNPEPVLEASELADQLQQQLPARIRQSWRWRLIYLRARIDGRLLLSDFKVDDVSQEYFDELRQMYHVETRTMFDLTPPARDADMNIRAWEIG